MRFDELLPQLDRLVPPLKLKEGSISPRYRPDCGLSPRDKRPDESGGRKEMSRERKGEGEVVSPREKRLPELASPRDKEGASPRDGKEKSVSPRDEGPDHK
jgi:hypothetical protein